jgi:hypothetical protein
MDLCGLKVTPEGAVEPNGKAPEKPRVVFGAMRVLAGFDLLAIKHKRLRYLGVSFKVLEQRKYKFVMDPEIERKAVTFIREERMKLRDRLLAEKEAAEAAEGPPRADSA